MWSTYNLLFLHFWGMLIDSHRIHKASLVKKGGELNEQKIYVNSQSEDLVFLCYKE